MKRLTILALAVLALAAVPAALADNGTPSAGPQTANRGGGVRVRIELLRLRLQVAELRFAVHCRAGVGKAPQQCTDFANKAVTRLQTLDGKIQQKIQDLQACTSDGSDRKCRNAQQKIDLLQKIDTAVTGLIGRLQDWLNGTATPDASGGSGLPGLSGGGSQSGNGIGAMRAARLQKLQDADAKVQQRIQELQGCSADSKDPKCRKASAKLARLQAMDQKIQALIAKLQGSPGASASAGTANPSSDSSLDNAANGLGQLVQGLGG